MKSRVTAENFVRAWQNASDVKAFSKVTGLKSASARARARLYRRKGIKLKMFPRGHSPGAPPLDVASLNKLAVAATKPVAAASKKIAAKKAKRPTKKRSSKKPARSR